MLQCTALVQRSLRRRSRSFVILQVSFSVLTDPPASISLTTSAGVFVWWLHAKLTRLSSGYRHEPFQHCPQAPYHAKGKCWCDETQNFGKDLIASCNGFSLIDLQTMNGIPVWKDMTPYSTDCCTYLSYVWHGYAPVLHVSLMQSRHLFLEYIQVMDWDATEKDVS